jgi:hypothetical protein
VTPEPRGLTERARDGSTALAQRTATAERFGPAATAGPPEPVRLGRAIASGTPLSATLEIHIDGEIRLGRRGRSLPRSD